MHIGSPPVMTAIREGVCDGFVLGGGATQVMRDGALASRAGMPFWLQLVGSGLTTAFSVHLGAVLDQARWPAIPCLNIYSDPLVTGLKTEGGCIRVPQAPGLGVELDWEAVERFRVAPEYRKPGRRQIHAIYWPDGRTSWYPDGRYRADFLAGRLPPFLSGVSLETRLDDGTEGFAREYQDRFPQAR
jgi:galactonate dehydratase